ncbi:hypothetical protein P389DRAFT_194768 [Cystobasidium minutum MCA 4210]|uniref:uncharacterized protein n=1 Tax=Cystobasidium minutum MCA 4210 TaxID=1397322 RepID=UPI0034CEAB88|eukprot:jgi/Rhomi1/194768/gm1.2982_g
MDERSRSNSQTSDTGIDFPTVNLATRLPEHDRLQPSPYANTLQEPDHGSADIGKAAEPVIQAVRRARKLEQVFGSLPPAQLYSRSARWVPGASNRFASDNVSLSSRVSRSSIHRARVASIRFIAESQDPELVEDFARVVLSEESDASDVESGMASLAAFAQQGSAAARNAGLEREYKMADHPHILGDDADSEDDADREEEEEYLSGPADKTFTEQAAERVQKDALAQDAYRSSIDTDGSHPSAGKISSDLHSSVGILGSSPGSGPSGTDLLHQRFDRGKSRKNRDSVLSGVTAHSSTGSAYAVDRYGRPQRSHSRASHTTSAGNGTPRSSMDSVRIQFKRAHKLATVFGTTRGEVFHRVLDDIEADIAEADDEEMDEDDRREIIESVAALRASL